MRSALHKKFLPPSGRGVAPDSLLTDLLAYWPLDEQSGFRYNALDPTAFSALFVNSNSEYLSGDLSILNLAGFASGKTFNFWLKPTLAFQGGIFGSSTDVFRAIVTVAGAVTIYCYDADGNPAHYTQVDLIAGSIVANAWQMLTIWYDPADKKLHAAVNNGAVVDGNALVTTPKAMVDSSIFGSNTGGANFWDGNFSRTGVWSRVLTAPERTELYNSGRGKLFSQLSAGIQVGLVSYWNLGELSGNRADSFGANTLTDNNTVGADFDYPGILKLTDNNTVTYVNDGPRGVSASFVSASSENLNRSSAFFPLSSGGWTIAGWFKDTGAAQNPRLRVTNAAVTQYVTLQNGGSDGWFLAYISNGVQSDNPGASATPRVWHFIVITYDPSDKKERIYIDAVLAGTSVAMAAGDPDFTGGTFDVGLNCDDIISRVGVWSRVLSQPDISALYRLGIGKSYSDLGPPEKVNLVSYWNLDEVSEGGVAGAVTRNDSHGTNHLTDNNTVTSYHTGPESVVPVFVSAPDEYLSAAFNASLNIAGDVTYAVWFKNITGVGPLIGFEPADVFPPMIMWITGNTLNARIAASPADFQSVDMGIAINDDKWHLAVSYFKSSDRKCYLRIDNTYEVSTAAIAGATLRNMTNEPFDLARSHPGYLGYDGKLSYAGVWSKLLSPAEMTELFNSGVGKKYSELSAGIKTNLVSYWNLTELSGNRADSHGANTLTDNNTVMSVINMPDVANNIAGNFTAANSEFLSHVPPIPGATSQVTLSMWIKANDNNRRGLFEQGILTSVKGWVLETSAVAPGDVNLFMDNGYTIYCYTAGLVIPIGSWAHIVLTYDGTQIVATDRPHIYVNGADKALTFVGVPPANLDVGDVLNLGLAIGRYFDGQIDEVAFYSRTLTPVEITRLFNLGKGIFYPTFTP